MKRNNLQTGSRAKLSFITSPSPVSELRRGAETSLDNSRFRNKFEDEEDINLKIQKVEQKMK